QMRRTNPASSSNAMIVAMAGEPVEELSIQEQVGNPFGLMLGRSGTVYVLDKRNQAIFAQANITNLKGIEGIVNKTSEQCGAANGVDAILVLDTGAIVHWNLTNGMVEPLYFDDRREDGTTINLHNAVVKSISFDSTAKRAALILGSRDKSQELVVSKGQGA